MTDEMRAREIAEQIIHATGGDPKRLNEAAQIIALEIRSGFRAGIERAARNDRQRRVAEWCAAAFGADHASSLPQRGVRLLEEAIELYQAAGGTAEMAHRLVDFVFSRPVGELSQELGGVGITLLALAAAAGESADAEERRELERVLAKPLSHFAARNAAKNAAGFEVGHSARALSDGDRT